MSTPTEIEGLLRELAPQALGTLVRRYDDFDTCEDAVQEALLAAALQWPAEGIPANPKGWLATVASRRWIERWRQEAAPGAESRPPSRWHRRNPNLSRPSTTPSPCCCCAATPHSPWHRRWR